MNLTFLEFVITRHLGPSEFVSGTSSVWHCPFHHDDNPSFWTRPHKAEYKDRWNCFGCGAWGDQWDFLLRIRPYEDYGNRQHRMDALRKAYDGGEVDTPSRGAPESDMSEGDFALFVFQRMKKMIADQEKQIEEGMEEFRRYLKRKTNDA